MARKKNVTRADGRIAVQVYLGRDEENKRKYKTVYGNTQKEADEKALQVKLAKRKGIDISAMHDTFGDWAERWLRFKKKEVSNGQYRAYECATKHLNTRLKDSPISKLMVADVQEVINRLSEHNEHTGKPTSKKTLESIKSTAIQIFSLAIENRVMEYNPASAIRIPSTAAGQKRRALSEEEQQWILETDHRAKRAAMIMMYAGLRRGELIPLTWNDIDLANHTISINKATEVIKGQFVVKETAKTDFSLRTIDIPQRLVDFLKAEPRESIYVCITVDGKMHTESSWNRMWESYLQDLNIKYGNFNAFAARPKSKFDPKGVPFVIAKITPHWLRHTYATMLYFAGYDINEAMAQLGHVDAKTTIQIYTHLDAKHKRKAMGKLNSFLGGASHMQVSND